jgi:hypothetical protein
MMMRKRRRFCQKDAARSPHRVKLLAAVISSVISREIPYKSSKVSDTTRQDKPSR